MSRRIGETTKARENSVSMWMFGVAAALMALLVWTPITALAEDSDAALNGWVLEGASVVSLPESLDAELDLEDRTLDAIWQEDHSRGLSGYTWDYDVELSWSAPPAILAAGESAPLVWTIENANVNPLIPEENLAWAFYAPELRWAGLGDADTLPCDHSPTYLAFEQADAGHTCDAITRAPDNADDRMAIILESGIFQNGEWQNIIIQYTYTPASLNQDYVDQVSEFTTVSDSTARFIESQPTMINCSNDCGIGVWLTQA